MEIKEGDIKLKRNKYTGMISVFLRNRLIFGVNDPKVFLMLSKAIAQLAKQIMVDTATAPIAGGNRESRRKKD